jgi:hypothetical protein
MLLRKNVNNVRSLSLSETMTDESEVDRPPKTKPGGHVKILKS